MKRLTQKLDCLPTVLDYKELLNKICVQQNITRDQARSKYGKFTYKQWSEILK